VKKSRFFSDFYPKIKNSSIFISDPNTRPSRRRSCPSSTGACGRSGRWKRIKNGVLMVKIVCFPHENTG
jgi:hypothetical protein